MKFFYRFFRESGIDLKKFKNILYFPRFINNLFLYRKKSKVKSLFPCLSDWKEQSGVTKGHYFHQDLLIAQKIFENKPENHLDIGSRVDGFVAHVASFRKINVIDIRPQKNKIKNINFIRGDLSLLNSNLFNKYSSVSCLHTLEHIGLGRYGDKLDFEGHKKAAKNLKNILKCGGTLYVSVPITNKERVEFNAHRVFNIKTILDLFKDLKLISFSYVNDSGDLLENININNLDLKNNYNLNFGCGIFELQK
jgi:hypothetical protein